MIYIVIPVYNRKELTRGCLESLQQQIFREFSIIVVDDGSSDGTSEMIKDEHPDVKLIHGDGTLWWAGSVNEGIRYALSVCQPDDYILTLNDDLIVPVDYLSGLSTAADIHPDAIIGSVETTIDDPKTIKSGGIYVNWRTAKVKVLNKGKSLDEFLNGFCTKVSRVTGRGTLFPSQVFREVGLYDEWHIKQCADTELPVRANFKFGYPLFVSYDAVVFSHVREKENINLKAYYKLSDFKDYFFDIRSHFNLKNRFLIARRIAPNKIWFVRYLLFNVLRTIGHFILRLKFGRTSDSKTAKL